MFLNSLIGFVLSLVVAGIAYLKKSLNLSGLVSATVLGTIIYGFGSYVIWSILILFFVSSSLITNKEKSSDYKGRNAIQVFANGSLAALFSVFFYVFKQEVYLVAAAISIATSNSDTWASELGKKSQGVTISIVNFKRMQKGLSGAISLIGTLASFFGAIIIGLVFGLLYAFKFQNDLVFLYMSIVILGGFLGNIIDSYLGALLQVKYIGKVTGFVTEKPFLDNDTVLHFKGLKWMNNDWVNFISGLISVCLAWLIYIF